MPLLISTAVMFQEQNRISCCVLQDHYDDGRDKTVFHNKHNTRVARPRLIFFGLRPVLS